MEAIENDACIPSYPKGFDVIVRANFCDALAQTEDVITETHPLQSRRSSLSAIPDSNPMTITAGADGNLWFVDVSTNYSIGRMTPTGQITEFPMTTQGTSGFGIAAGPDGNVWYSVLEAGKLGRVTRAGQSPSTQFPRRILWSSD